MIINLKMSGGRYIYKPAKETSEEIMSEVARATEAAITEEVEEDAFAHVDNTPAPAPAPKKQISKAAKIMKQTPVPDPAPEAETEQTDITLDVVLSNLKADSDNLASDYADLIRILGNTASADPKRIEELEAENAALKEKCAKLQKAIAALTA